MQRCVNGVGLGELVLKDDDAAGGFQRGALIEELTGSGRDPQLISGVPAVSAFGALRSQELCLVKAPEKRRRGAQDPRGAAHAVGRIVFVVELVVRIPFRGTVIFFYDNAFRMVRREEGSVSPRMPSLPTRGYRP